MAIANRKIVGMSITVVSLFWTLSAFAAQPSPGAMDPKMTQAIKEGSKVPLGPASNSPDLSLEVISVNPSPLNQGDTATLTVVVKNIGGTKSRAVPLFLHGDEAALQAFGVPMQNGMEHGVPMPEIGPGQGFTYSINKPIALPPKSYTIRAVIWPGNKPMAAQPQPGAEGNLSNNEKEVQFTIKPAALKPSNLGPKHKIPVENLPSGSIKN
jgi:hypothetical protein